MKYEEKIQWIWDAPIGINARSIEFVPAHLHEDLLEIIFCIKGSVRFLYGYEEFLLQAGDFISVDKDAHYLQNTEEENICVSFYINLKFFSEKYPYITNMLFVCEPSNEDEKDEYRIHKKKIKGILIAILFYISNKEKCENDFSKSLVKAAEGIVNIFLNYFDITYFYNPELVSKTELMERNHKMMGFLQTHSSEKITLEDMAKNFNLTKSYVSEFLRTFEIGFRQSLSYIRANNSEKLLLNTDMNITDISEACGFSDVKYYYAAFKKWYKCTPSEFRRIYKTEMLKDAAEKELDIKSTTRYVNEMLKSHYLDMFLFDLE